MANIMTKRGSQDNVITYEHICDTAADMANIESRYITLGSTCIVLKGESGGLEVYMANTAHEWESLLDNSAAASGEVQPIDFHICSQSEYNSTTLQPTISSPDSNTFYLVPASEETGNLYDEWVYLDSKWERFGGAKIPSYTEATIAAAGLMSATDKAKLDQFLAASNYVTDVSDKADKTDTVIVNSLSMGRKANTTIGAGSTAIGYSTTASDINTLAEGSYTIASGENAHAEGASSQASGSQSHAEGSGTLASGDNSHAEGAGSQSTALYAHAEGYNTKASGQSAHAEGYYSKATSDYSHVEGDYSIASASRAHAEGHNVEASGDSSHGEGNYTKATGNYSHAEGSYTLASGIASHAEGYSGTLTKTINNVVYKSGATGDQSHAEGQYTYAGGQNSHAEGDETAAIASDSHAEGYATQATNSRAHAEGYYSKATGGDSHAEGHETTASGNNSHAEGEGGAAAGTASHKEGFGTNANGNYSHAEGYWSISNGTYAHAEGYNTRASNQASHAEGYTTEANGIYAHAEGYDTSAIGYSSHAEGCVTSAHGQYTHTEGYSTHAFEDASHAEGYSTYANGIYTHAEGAQTQADGAFAHSEGKSTRAIGASSHVGGLATLALGRATTVFGVNNYPLETITRPATTTLSVDNVPDWDASKGYEYGDVVKVFENGQYKYYCCHLTYEANQYPPLAVKQFYINNNVWTLYTLNQDDNLDLIPEWTIDGIYPSSSKVKITDELGQAQYYISNSNIPIDYTNTQFWHTQPEGSTWARPTKGEIESHTYSSVTSNYAEIVGNGFYGKSNARALDWQGNEYLMGDLYIHCDNKSSNGQKVATEATVNLLLERIAQLEARVAALEGYHIPANAVEGENGEPITDEQGNILEFDTPTT